MRVTTMHLTHKAYFLAHTPSQQLTFLTHCKLTILNFVFIYL